jgi:hypothetical protein
MTSLSVRSGILPPMHDRKNRGAPAQPATQHYNNGRHLTA